jgi:tetratricopeptide (TPR) repeat protein
MRRTGIDFATYEALAAGLLRKAPRDVDNGTPVFATFSLAIDKAAEACPEAAKLMGLCAFLAPDRIPLSLFTAEVLSEIELGEAVAALSEVSLVALDPLDDGSPGIGVHRLVQAVMRGRLSELGEHQNAAALATELLADAYPNPASDVRNWPACARLTPHAMALFEHAPDSGKGSNKTSLLLNQTAINYVSRAAYPEAEPLYRRALAIDEAGLGADHPSVAIDLNNLAQLLQDTNRLAEAEPLMRRALAIDEAGLGADHPSVAIDLNNLAQLLKATNRLAEAEPLMRRALAIFDKSLGADHPNTRTASTNLESLLAVLSAPATGRPAGTAETPCSAPGDGGSPRRGFLARLFGRWGAAP